MTSGSLVPAPARAAAGEDDASEFRLGGGDRDAA
jgi:hypothetical protein